jgi:hypothetical protein
MRSYYILLSIHQTPFLIVLTTEGIDSNEILNLSHARFCTMSHF